MSGSGQFYSSLCVDAKLKCGMSQLRKRMACIPSLKLISYGTRLRYQVINEKEKQVLELESGAIRFTFYFSKPDDKLLSACLMRLIALLAVVDDLYEIKLGAIYRYMVDALGKQALQFVGGDSGRVLIERLSKNVTELTFANSKLAHSVYDKAANEKALKEKMADCREFCAKVIEVVSRRGINVNEELEKLFGIGAVLTDKVTKVIKENGD